MGLKSWWDEQQAGARKIPVLGQVVQGTQWAGDQVAGGASKLGNWFGGLDPTKVQKTDTTPIGAAAAGAQQPVDQFAQYLASAGMRPAPTIQATSIANQIPQGTAAMALNPAQVTAATIANAQTAESRAQQQQALGLALSAAQGNAPSAAAIQMQQGSDAAIKAQMAAANSGRGGFNAGAVRNAQMQGANMQQANVQQTGALRAQEMAQARNDYAGQANTIAGNDIGMATSQAGLAQSANTTNAGAANNFALANQGATNQMTNANNSLFAQGLSADQGAALAASQGNATNQMNMYAQLNDLTTKYMQAGLDAASARQKAATDMASIQSGQAAQATQARSAVFGGVLNAGGGIAASAIGGKK